MKKVRYNSLIFILLLISFATSSLLLSNYTLSNAEESIMTVQAQQMKGNYTGQDCVNCHVSTMPGLVQSWNMSKHAQNEIYCDTCHGQNHEALVMPTETPCKSCHPQNVEQFVEGKHHLAWVAMEVVAENVLQLNETIKWKGCGYCHRIGASGDIPNWGPSTPGVADTPGAKCDSCHTRHTFSVIEARKPEACSNCHMGFDHPTYEMFMSSKHGIIYDTRGENYTWNYPYDDQWPNQAPVCITCHMDDGDHNSITAYGFYGILGPGVGPLADDPEWAEDNAEVLKGLAVLTPEGEPGVLLDVVKDLRIARLSDEEFQSVRQKEIQICSRCHSDSYIDKQFTQYEATTKESIHLLAEGVRLVAELYEEGVIQKPEAYPYNYPFMLAFYTSPTPIEQDLYLMLEQWHNRMFQGAFHESSDYMHWEGYAPMREHLVKMRAEAERMKQGEPVMPAQVGLPIPEILAIAALLIAIVAIILTYRVASKNKRSR